jgi:hypothetical protein
MSAVNEYSLCGNTGSFSNNVSPLVEISLVESAVVYGDKESSVVTGAYRNSASLKLVKNAVGNSFLIIACDINAHRGSDVDTGITYFKIVCHNMYLKNI